MIFTSILFNILNIGIELLVSATTTIKVVDNASNTAESGVGAKLIFEVKIK